MKLLLAVLLCCLSAIPISASTRGKKLIDYGYSLLAPFCDRMAEAATPKTTIIDGFDQYVWVYSERLRWWNGTAPKPYVEALALSKQGPGR